MNYNLEYNDDGLFIFRIDWNDAKITAAQWGKSCSISRCLPTPIWLIVLLAGSWQFMTQEHLHTARPDSQSCLSYVVASYSKAT